MKKIILLLLFLSSCSFTFESRPLQDVDILLNEDIDGKVLTKLYKEIEKQHEDLPIDEEIIVYLNSNGGEVQATLVFLERLENLRSEGRKFTGVIYGFCYSACATIFSSMDKRYMTKKSLYVQHDIRLSRKPSKEELRIYQVLNNRRLEYDSLVLRQSTAELVRYFSSGGTYMASGEYFYELGVIHGIVPQPNISEI